MQLIDTRATTTAMQLISSNLIYKEIRFKTMQ